MSFHFCPFYSLRIYPVPFYQGLLRRHMFVIFLFNVRVSQPYKTRYVPHAYGLIIRCPVHILICLFLLVLFDFLYRFQILRPMVETRETRRYFQNAAALERENLHGSFETRPMPLNVRFI